jgi:hypothetical protein
MSEFEGTPRLRFEQRPSPVLGEHRPMYKIALVLLILEIASRGGKSSLPRLQLFSWAIKRSERRAQLINAAQDKRLQVAVWGFDPTLVIAIRIAIAEDIVAETPNGYEITNAGRVLTDEILKDAGLFVLERAFLSAVGKGLTERMVEEMARSWEEK